MLLLVVKNRYGLSSHGQMKYFMPMSIEPIYEADLVLYEPNENRFVLYSRDRRTGERVTTSLRGNRNGAKHAETFDPTGLDSTEALHAVAAMLKADRTPVEIDIPWLS